MLPDIIILAGGKGTRLQAVVQDVPKPMAPVAGKPFLAYLLDFLCAKGAVNIILSVGYKYESIQNYFGESYRGMRLKYVVEKEALGTGGAIKLALEKCESKRVLIYNGDTFFEADPNELVKFNTDQKIPLSIFLKPISFPDRYGTVQLEGNKIITFCEKQEGLAKGLINAGVYCFDVDQINWPKEAVFSFEKAVLEPLALKGELNGMINDAYFIDIGIPDDYKTANDTFGKMEY